MKKFMVVLGIAFALFVGIFALANRPVDVDALNAERYEEVCEQIENRFGEDAVYTIKPRITRNGVVDSYRADIVTIDGFDIDTIAMNYTFE